MTKKISSSNISDLDVLKQPWAIRPEMMDVLLNLAHKQVSGEHVTREEVAARMGVSQSPDGYYVRDGVAIVPINGVIGKGRSWAVDAPVEQIQHDFLTAMDDTAVKKIVLLIDSPGGSVMGTPELADLIHSQRGQKPIVSYVQGQMCSGAYFIGSSADAIYASKASVIGSIGVYMMLFDFSVLLHNIGIKTNLIKAGKFKAAGNMASPMTDDERATMQEHIDTFYSLFVGTVSRNRGISNEAAEKLADGRVWIGQKSLDVGLIDGIKTFEEVLSTDGVIKLKPKSTAVRGAQIENLGSESTAQQEEEQTMNREKLKAEHKAVAEELIAEGKAIGLEEAKNGNAAAVAAAKEAGVTEGKDAAITAEKARVDGIVKAMPTGMEKIAIKAIQDGVSVEACKDLYLKAHSSSAPQSLGPNAEETGAQAVNKNTPEAWGKKYDSDPAIRAEFSSKETYIGYMKAETGGRVKRLAK